MMPCPCFEEVMQRRFYVAELARQEQIRFEQQHWQPRSHQLPPPLPSNPPTHPPPPTTHPPRRATQVTHEKAPWSPASAPAGKRSNTSSFASTDAWCPTSRVACWYLSFTASPFLWALCSRFDEPTVVRYRHGGTVTCRRHFWPLPHFTHSRLAVPRLLRADCMTLGDRRRCWRAGFRCKAAPRANDPSPAVGGRGPSPAFP